MRQTVGVPGPSYVGGAKGGPAASPRSAVTSVAVVARVQHVPTIRLEHGAGRLVAEPK